MTTEFEITCIISDNNDEDRRIQKIGGTGWIQSLDSAIESIEDETFSYYVMDKDTEKRLEIIIAERNNRKYLKTETDGVEPNNLLELDVCKS